MKTTWMMVLAVAAVASMGAGGCDENERLAEYAKNSVEQQTKQNEQIAKQNSEVTQQNRQVAEGAQKLVEADAKARQELVTAQKTLHEGLRAERMTLDQQRSEIEHERKDIAGQRHRDPLIANAINGSVLLVACLLPLIICVYLLSGLHKDRGDESALNELLVTELTAECPRLLLPRPEIVPKLERQSPSDDGLDGTDVIENSP